MKHRQPPYWPLSVPCGPDHGHDDCGPDHGVGDDDGSGYGGGGGSPDHDGGDDDRIAMGMMNYNG